MENIKVIKEKLINEFAGEWRSELVDVKGKKGYVVFDLYFKKDYLENDFWITGSFNQPDKDNSQEFNFHFIWIDKFLHIITNGLPHGYLGISGNELYILKELDSLLNDHQRANNIRLTFHKL